MNFNSIIEQLECKNEEICLFLKRSLCSSNSSVDKITFDLLFKKLNAHDQILIDALQELNKKFETLTLSLIKHSK